MSKLYQDLADVYEAMYYTFINYQEEYEFYGSILKKHGKQQVLEIGSGTGNLAACFIKNGFDYLGLDYSSSMIDIAKSKLPDGNFFQGDMRNFQLSQPVQSIISTGRTLSYLLNNADVNTAFASMCRNLEKGGILCFDFIDANKFVPAIVKNGDATHEAIFKKTTYVRKSNWTTHFIYGMDLIWKANYYKKEGDAFIELGKDQSEVRTFTANEIEIFLSINGFKVLTMMKRASYYFPTFVVVAEKI